DNGTTAGATNGAFLDHAASDEAAAAPAASPRDSFSSFDDDNAAIISVIATSEDLREMGLED
ncbi:unnamed protein product, partial [Amoebophrya sp. A120]